MLISSNFQMAAYAMGLLAALIQIVAFVWVNTFEIQFNFLLLPT